MRLGKTYEISRLRDYSSLFSRNEVNRWYKSDWSSVRIKIDRYDSSILQRQCSYLSYIKHVYRIIEKFYPNEYVYKNEFIHRWLMEEVGVADSVVFNEFRLGKAVADLVMFNGVSRVFEIKTMFDKDVRLNNQLEQYKRLFNEVYLVVPQEKSHLYLKHSQSAGVIIYNQTTNLFSRIKEAKCIDNIEVDALMEVLHTNEYVGIVKEYYGESPKFDDFNKFRVCKELIKQIPTDVLSRIFVSLMKQRRQNLFSKKEHQFNQLFLAMNYTASQKYQLLSNLNTVIC